MDLHFQRKKQVINQNNWLMFWMILRPQGLLTLVRSVPFIKMVQMDRELKKLILKRNNYRRNCNFLIRRLTILSLNFGKLESNLI